MKVKNDNCARCGIGLRTPPGGFVCGNRECPHTEHWLARYRAVAPEHFIEPAAIGEAIP